MVMHRGLGRRWVRFVGLAGIAAAGYVAGITADRVTAQQPAPAPAPAPAPMMTQDKRIVAYIYQNMPITREELGDFLIARGGFEKLELLVNKRIIEVEAARRNITVTPLEIQATLEADVRGLGISLDLFTKEILAKRYNKTLYEWTEDVIKPRLMLGKMCKDRVIVAEEDIKKAYENRYGEKRQAKIICWNKEDERAALRQWDEARKSDADFDRIARQQRTPNLAASGGLIAPIGRFPDVEDETCTKKLYALRDIGEMTELFKTPAGIICMKLVAVIPADQTAYKLTEAALANLKNAKLSEEVMNKLSPLKNKEFSRGDLIGELARIIPPAELKHTQDLVLQYGGDTVTSYAKVRNSLEREVYEKRQAAEIPKFFTELKKLAQPNLLLKGPPSQDEIIKAAEEEVSQMKTAGTLPAAVPARKP